MADTLFTLALFAALVWLSFAPTARSRAADRYDERGR
jgi:hypothetical protein